MRVRETRIVSQGRRLFRTLIGKPCGLVWGALKKLEDALVFIASRSINSLAIYLYPLLPPLWLLFMGLLLWNHNALQAPAWIATSLAVMSGGAISLLAMRMALKDNRYYARVTLVFMIVPAAFGCWATLRSDGFDGTLSFSTLIDRSAGVASQQWPVGYEEQRGVFSMQMRDLINQRLKDLAKGEDLSTEERLGALYQLASSMDMADILILTQMAVIFSNDWRVKVYRGNELAVRNMRIRGRGRPIERPNTVSKKDLQEIFPTNPFIERLDDSFHIVLPPGMRVYQIPIQGWPHHATVFQDGHCKMRFEPGGTFSGRPGLTEVESERWFSMSLQVDYEVSFHALRIGTKGTKQRRAWIRTLIDQLENPTAIPVGAPVL